MVDYVLPAIPQRVRGNINIASVNPSTELDWCERELLTERFEVLGCEQVHDVGRVPTWIRHCTPTYTSEAPSGEG